MDTFWTHRKVGNVIARDRTVTLQCWIFLQHFSASQLKGCSGLLLAEWAKNSLYTVESMRGMFNGQPGITLDKLFITLLWLLVIGLPGKLPAKNATKILL